MRVLVCAALLLLSSAAPAVAAPPADLGRYDPEGLRAEQEAAELLSEASTETHARRPSCIQQIEHTRHGDLPITDAEPSVAVRSVLGIFRRPPTGEELALAADPNATLNYAGTLERSRQGVRVVRTASGQEIVITVLPRVKRLVPDPVLRRSCTETTRKIARRLRRSARPRVQRELTRMMRTLPGDDADLVTLPDIAEAVTITWPEGGTGGLFDTQRFSVNGTFLSVGREKRRSLVFGLVPDGVATVELRYPRYVSRGRYRDPMDYGRRHRRTVRVRENAFSATVPRGAQDSLPADMVWRSATGAVVRVVEPELG